MASANQLDASTILVVVLGTIILLPLFTMGFCGTVGYGGMMGLYGSIGGGWSIVLVPIIFLLVLLGGGYLVLRRLAEPKPGDNTAIEELRIAHARGDLTDEEFETRREKLERSE